MIKKVSVFIIVCAVCAAWLSGCDSKSAATHYGVTAKVVAVDTLEEMEEDAELIVKAVRLEGEEPIVTYSNGVYVSGFSFSQVEIEEIYKDSDERYEIGDVVTVLENEVYDENTNTVHHIAGYNMMVAGEEYLLFLSYAETEGSEYYVSSGVNSGTISLSDDGRTTAYTDQMGNAVVDFADYEDIWTEAVDKYIE